MRRGFGLVFVVILFSIACKAQDDEYFEKTLFSFGVVYSPVISSHQWQVGTAGTGEAFFLPKLTHYFSSFLALELKPQRFYIDGGIGFLGRRADYRWQSSINSQNSNVKIVYQNLNGFLGFRFKESKFDVALYGLFEKNLNTKSYLNEIKNTTSFKFGLSNYYFGIRPSVGFEQKIYSNIYSRFSLDLDLLTSNLISYGISIRVFRQNSK